MSVLMLMAISKGGFGWNNLALTGVQRLLAQVPTALRINYVVAVSVVTLVLIAVILVRNRRHDEGSATPVSVSLSPSLALAATLVSVTAFAADIMATQGWSAGRQSLSELTSASCGLADEIVVQPDAGIWRLAGEGIDEGVSLQALSLQRGGPVLVAPQIGPYFPCFRQPVLQDGAAEPPSMIIGVGGWPYGLDQSPYAYLENVFDLRLLTDKSTNSVWQQGIEVILVDRWHQVADVP
jgi:hypothetical protein